MNELVLSSYIQIMQDGLVEHGKQESAGRFILDSIASQEKAEISTNFDAKKISRLVSRKDPVPDDIKEASLNSKVASNVEEYFRDEVVEDLNPYTKDDILQKLMTLIAQDVSISKSKKDEFKRLFAQKDDAKFLSNAFLYSLHRNNRFADNKIEYQDIPLLEEVNYKCPLTRMPLVENIKGQPRKCYEITQIYPIGLTTKEEIDFSSISKRPDNMDDPSNLIALSKKAAEEYSIKPTLKEFEILLKIKEFTTRRTKALNSINRLDLEEEIRLVLDALVSLTYSSELPQLSYDALKIGEKIEDYLLQVDIEKLVVRYYLYIESVFSNISEDFDVIASEIKLCSQRLEKAGLSQEEVVDNLTSWIHDKTFPCEQKGTLACRIVVCFFIQNCEVFSK